VKGQGNENVFVSGHFVLPVFFAHTDEESSYGKGHRNFSIGGGNGKAFNSRYFIISASASYYAMDGLSVEASFENWSGANHGIAKIAPTVQYVFYSSCRSTYPDVNFNLGF
jgi:hypothetical protein